ncbi:MAG: LptF/LptG family permease [Paramuribaculum sp.]|nr:LptF/LptG family permease [Paramuribaculum sp.]
MMRSFVPLFVMTFFICLFIVLMQFLWKSIDDLVGKGLTFDVIAELFFYAALSMIPMALPLSILLASLMTFGNLGENFELTAIKASGVSLLKAMRPLIALIIAISIGAFFFQNDVLPIAQTKMWTLLFSVRQKSPEVEIPEGVFYDQIPGFNLYVESKNRDTGTLYDVMIYDMSSGFDNARVILADSGKLMSAADKVHLYLTLWKGEQFENLSDQQAVKGAGSVPYRRESFDFKEILLSFDANFNRMDEEGMRNQYVGKNIRELQATIDSVTHRIDSIGDGYGRELRNSSFFGVSPVAMSHVQSPKVGPRPEHNGADAAAADSRIATGTPDGIVADAPEQQQQRELRTVPMDRPINIDSLFRSSTSGRYIAYLNQALSKARRHSSDYQFKGMMMDNERYVIRRHAIELQKKFTLSFACIIFFFIGAPLGAIIRKGGLGMPLVISVFLFIFYYIVDNTGYKMARDGKLEVWEGMWLSAAVLLPLGVFLTYKAMKDSAVFNMDAYRSFFRSLLGLREKRRVDFKEVRIHDIDRDVARERLTSLAATAESLASRTLNCSYRTYWEGRVMPHAELNALRTTLDGTMEYLTDSPRREVFVLLNRYPVISWRWIYDPSDGRRPLSIAGMLLFPIGLPLYLIALFDYRRLRRELAVVAEVSHSLIDLTNSTTSTQNTDKTSTIYEHD